MFSNALQLSNILIISITFSASKLNMKYLFRDLKNLIEIKFPNSQTNELVEMEGILLNCISLNKVDLSNFNFKKINSFESLFEGCYNMTDIDISYINAPLLTNTTNLFKNCINIINIILPKNLSGITYLNSAFENCKNLKNIDLTPFDGIKNLLGVEKMFANCTSLKSLYFPKINAPGLDSTANMFLGCTKLKHLDMGNFTTSNNALYNLSNMFYDCKDLEYLDISKLYFEQGEYKGIFNGVGNKFDIEFKFHYKCDFEFEKEFFDMNIKNKKECQGF